MRLSDAKAQVEQEHPELTGTAKLEAIKALRERAAQERKAKAPTEGLPQCARCEQYVKPRRKGGGSGGLSLLAFTQLAAVVVAVVAMVNGFEPSGVGLVGVLVLWPALVAPSWLGLVAAVVALLVTAGVAGAASSRTVCPNCDAPLG